MKRILAADDSATIRQMVEYALRDGGYEVQVVPDGETALRALDAGSFDLVVTDLNMPGIDGLELIRQVRTRPAHRFTPILMLTTESAPEMKAAGQAAGATGWIVKPFRPDQLSGVVQQVLGS